MFSSKRQGIVSKIKEPALRSFLPVYPDKESTKKVYVSLDIVNEDKFLKDQVITRAKKELENWVSRYQQYKELSTLVRLIKEKLV